MDSSTSIDSQFRANRVLFIAGAGAASAGATVALVAPPAKAVDLTEVTDMITSLGGIATAALAVAVVPLGIAFALKIVKRVMR